MFFVLQCVSLLSSLFFLPFLLSHSGFQIYTSSLICVVLVVKRSISKAYSQLNKRNPFCASIFKIKMPLQRWDVCVLLLEYTCILR